MESCSALIGRRISCIQDRSSVLLGFPVDSFVRDPHAEVIGGVGKGGSHGGKRALVIHEMFLHAIHNYAVMLCYLGLP